MMFVSANHCNSIRQAIQDYHPDYIITVSSWPTFLYASGSYDYENPRTGLFQGELLLKVWRMQYFDMVLKSAQAFKYIFTSPTSAELDPKDQHDGVSTQRHSRLRRTTGERRTRCHVAGILNMTSVQPRAIAYIAVQVLWMIFGSYLCIAD